jgi:hypothetical protein
MAAHPQGLTLDQLSEELLRKPLGYAEIDELIGALEEAGVDLRQAPADPQELVRVLAAVRALTEERGARPSLGEIAERAGMTVTAVRRVLQYGKSLGP